MVAESDKKKWSTKETIWVVMAVGTLLVQTLYLKFSLELTIHEEINNRIADFRVIQEQIKSLEKQIPSGPTKNSYIFYKQSPAEKPEQELDICSQTKNQKS